MIPASDTAMASPPDDKAPVEALILNGIDEFLQRSDLIDRSVVLRLPPIAEPDRRDDALFWEAFQRDRPRILGGLLDAVVGGLRELPLVELTKLPRMAGFARFAEAVGRNLGWQPERVLSDYAENRRAMTAAQLQDSPLLNFMIANAHQVNDSTWTADELLADLSMHAQKLADLPRWPKSAQWFSIELRRIAPRLREHGIHVEFVRDRGKRLITLVNARPSNDRWSPAPLDDPETCFTGESGAEGMAPGRHQGAIRAPRVTP